MLYVDIPTRPEFKALNDVRADACVSIYLGTTPLTQASDASRIELGNLAKQAREQLEAVGFDKRRLASLMAHFDDLADDDDFWRLQANSLALLATPDRLRTFRLATKVAATVQVSDRFHLKPLLRAMAFPQHAFLLALSENDARLVEVFADQPPVQVRVPDLPDSAADAVGRASVNNLTQGTRQANAEGQKKLLLKYARKVDAALRPVLAGRETPLILAATEPLGPIFRSVNSYPALLDEGVSASPDRMSDSDLAQAARAEIDSHYAAEVATATVLFQERIGQHRATTDLRTVARAATFGAVDLLLVDIDEVMSGTVDETDGSITHATAPGADSYDVIDEIAGRAILAGAKVLAARRADMPDEVAVAAILRYPV